MTDNDNDPISVSVEKCEKTANYDRDEDITYYDCGWDTDKSGLSHETYHKGYGISYEQREA